MRLLTESLKERIAKYPLYSQDGKGEDAICIAIFALGSIRWYILEGQNEDDDCVLFGIVIGLAEDEYGYISLKEISDLKIMAPISGTALLIREQNNFVPTPLSTLNDDRLKRFLKRIHREDNED